MQELLPLLTKPSHYLGAEPGAVRKDPGLMKGRVALAFPDLYQVGMSYLGQMILYHAVNQEPDLWAERVYSVPPETAELLRGRGARLSTLESDAPLTEMDVLGFSLTHELCYTNVLAMLDQAGIPRRSDQRGDREVYVIAGGGSTFNAEPLAPFIDLMVLGDGELLLPGLVRRLAEARRKGRPRRDMLEELAGEPGVYVPSFFEDPGPGLPLRALLPGYERVDKTLVLDLDGSPYPIFSPQAFEAVHDRLTVELARGCTRGCRFCQAGMIYRPVRERSVQELARLTEEGLRASGHGDLSFLALSAGDFSALTSLFGQTVDRCRAEQVSISLPSLRVGSVDEDIAARIAGIRRTGATLAPEAGTQRLRDVINKGVTEDELLEHVRTLFKLGWNSIKLYYMMGLPTETREDLEAILDLCRRVESAAGGRKRLQVSASVSTFVPKPHTPFQWERQIGLEETRERVRFMLNLFRPHKRLRFRWHTPEMSWLEGVFSRGDRRLAPLVEAATDRGALFASWNDHLRLEPWREAMEETGVDPEAYLAARDPEAALPWDHLNCGVDKAFLLRERKRALEERITEDCRFHPCRACGVCGEPVQGRTSSLAGQESLGPLLNQPYRDQVQRKPEGAVEQTPMDVKPRPPALPEELAVRAARYRLWYRKVGRAAYLSQLEFQSVLERALRRAGLPMSFSQGFHPTPKVSFARALPVGVESLAEYADLWLREALGPVAVYEALAPRLSEGLELYRVEELPRRPAPSIAEAFELTLTPLAGPEDRELFERRWRDFMDAETHVWTRQTKKGERSTDIRPLFAELEPMAEGVFFVLDWSEVYLSPLSLAREIMPELDATKWRLVKTGQRFAAAGVASESDSESESTSDSAFGDE